MPNAILRAIELISERVRNLEASQERAEVAGAVPRFTVAGLPAAGVVGRVAFATDGRKVGEGAGSGTGVLAYDDGVAWRRTSDDTTVAA